MEAILFVLFMATSFWSAYQVKRAFCKSFPDFARFMDKLEHTPEDETNIEKRKPISAGTDTGEKET